VIKVKIEGVVLDLKSNLPIIVLRDDKQRVLPISVGLFEAQAIAFAMEGIKIPRPFTHDLAKSIIEKLGAKVMRVELTELKGNTYFAYIIMKPKDGEEIRIDSRPSDAIAIALRFQAQIFASEELLLLRETYKPIDESEVKSFREIIDKLPPDEFWKKLRDKK